VCDSEIDADARKCPSCLTDLSLFDLGGGSFSETLDVHPAEGKTIDDILASIMEGRADQPEIFETLKSVATARPAAEEMALEAKKGPAVEPFTDQTEKQFLCPVCDTVVRPDDRVCPGCGAEFSEGEATEYECPVCKASVPADADHCPSCGVQFATEETQGPVAGAPSAQPMPEIEAAKTKTEATFGAAAATMDTTVIASKPRASLRESLKSRLDSLRDEKRAAKPKLPEGDRKLMARELPRLVNEVKPLLVSAKRIGLDIETGKRQINDAVQAGKRREIEAAVRLIAEARVSLDLAFIDFLGSRIEALAREVDGSPSHPSATEIGGLLQESLAALEKGDYDAAWNKLEAATQLFQAQAKEYNEARGIIEDSDRLLSEAKGLGMDVRQSERLVRQSREAMDRRDFPAGLRLARQAMDRLMREVPSFVQEEMRKARNRLLDLKMRGGDVSKAVGILKEASIQVKDERWSEAIRFLKEFQREVGHMEKV